MHPRQRSVLKAIYTDPVLLLEVAAELCPLFGIVEVVSQRLRVKVLAPLDRSEKNLASLDGAALLKDAHQLDRRVLRVDLGNGEGGTVVLYSDGFCGSHPISF